MVLPKSKLGLNRSEAQLRLHLQGGIGPASRRNKARLALWLLLDETVGQRYTNNPIPIHAVKSVRAATSVK
jgi:hypothetical protein